ncbi:M28 family peptidase [Croceibacterium sp. LX-88]|uniref:M28 family peptidase n=1 Tax=Croceibacterium selenioxidans TaxID=2838833 RepID=A0ABS5W6Y0_9SPHN|nr:M28 family peptidase [Croceibacterium selenioxidans]MBT2135439.1 M28 family peptidase [Croceibacterium selenioxidans]
MLKIVSASVLSLAAAASAVAAGGGVPKVAAGQIPEATVKEGTRVLSLDEFEGRAPGTPGEEKTVAYLIEQFTKAGLKPGNNGSWVQEVPLVEITASHFKPLTIAGKGASKDYTFATDWVGVTYREQPRTDLAPSEIVFVGYGINAPEKGWNDYAGIDMHGKTALILINDADYKEEGLEGPFNGRAMTYYGRWTYKFEEAARQGAAAAIIVHDTFPAAYGWGTVESSWTGPQAHAVRKDGGADQTQVNGWVQLPVAREIAQMAGKNLDELIAAAGKPGFTAVPLGLTASTGFDNAIRRFDSKNVVAMLPGKSRPDEYVLHTAHWDHLGRCTPNAAGDDICNGAIDNATGTAALVALGEAHAKAGPADRSLLFVAVTAEESGLLGSEYFADNPTVPLDHIVGGLNMDALSLAGPARDVSVIGGGKSELDDYLKIALADLGRVATPDASPQAGYYYRSDHFSLAKRGVPMFYVKSGQDLVEGGREAGRAFEANYRERAYHMPDDEYDPNWNWGGVVQDLQLFYRLGRTLAEDDKWPNWLPGDEFRRIRDESCKPEGGC